MLEHFFHRAPSFRMSGSTLQSPGIQMKMGVVKNHPDSAVGCHLLFPIFQVPLKTSQGPGRNWQEAFAFQVFMQEEDPPANPPKLIPVLQSGALIYDSSF